MMIELRDLRFGYGDGGEVLRGIDLVFDRPEFVCILGPNGVGKSTLIHCINRILKPKDGMVLMDGRDANTYRLKQLAEHMGYVPAATNDSFPLTVVDSIMVGLDNGFRIGTPDEDLEKVDEVLRLMHIEDLAMKRFDELSAGQHQRVALARGMVRSPEVLLLDEPTSNLDVKHQLQVAEMLSTLPSRKGTLVLMISHDINIAAKYADRVILLHDGRVYADGAPADVITGDSIRDIYEVESDVVQVDGRPHVILKRAIGD